MGGCKAVEMYYKIHSVSCDSSSQHKGIEPNLLTLHIVSNLNWF